MSMRLYELADNFRQVSDLLLAASEASVMGDEGSAEAVQTWKDTLESIDAPLEQKMLACAAIIRERKADAEALKAECQRLAKRQKAAEKAEDGLRDYLAATMQATGKLKVKDERFTLSLGEGRPKVQVTDIEALKARQDVWKPYKYDEVNLDKTIIKAMLDEGQVVDGVQIVSEKVLTIR